MLVRVGSLDEALQVLQGVGELGQGARTPPNATPGRPSPPGAGGRAGRKTRSL